tara:strand:+ start:3320 stop:3526 length:207 start_codon:yes stop_codon:yes gene_type:complete
LYNTKQWETAATAITPTVGGVGRPPNVRQVHLGQSRRVPQNGAMVKQRMGSDARRVCVRACGSAITTG